MKRIRLAIIAFLAVWSTNASAQDAPEGSEPESPAETLAAGLAETARATADAAAAPEQGTADESESEPGSEPDPVLLPAVVPSAPAKDLGESEVAEGTVVAPQLSDAEPEDLDPPAGHLSTSVGAQYRVRSVRIDPIELSGELVRDISWTEQRARLDARTEIAKVGALTLQLDALDGVLFGDNGSFVGIPKTNSGVSLSTKRPNITRWAVGLRPGGDALEPDDYGPVLVPASALDINYLYADIFLPIGLLRIGRQPLNYGATVTSHDGEDRNRWGVSSYSDGVDRILFGTKIDEIVKAISGKGTPDPSPDNGVLLAVLYDFMTQGDVAVFDDDLREFGGSLQWRAKSADWFGLSWRNFQLSQSVVRLYNEGFDSEVFGFPFYFETTVDRFRFEAQFMRIQGRTEEISEGFAALASKPPVRQDLLAHAARVVLDGKFGPVTATLEFDYASGDDDPRSTTPITSYSYARDLNVGLLMFEHIIAFESARSVAVGIENLSGADVSSFPLTEASTDGRFTNAIAAFPQLRVDIWEHPAHRVHAQVGGLLAWSAAPGGVVDPILTSIAEDGERIDDDAVNYHGGRPDRFYGTEIDLQLGYTLYDNFEWVLEGAVLLPGPALEDENGDAVNSFLMENRFVLSF